MQRAKTVFAEVAGRVLFIGFGIQIILGIIWIISNFGTVQKFEETFLYLQISENLICDEYEAVLYPVLIRMARGVEQLLSVSYHYMLYLIQIVVALGAAWKLLQELGIAKVQYLIFGSLALLTCPVALQCHLAVTPDSLACSFLLLETAFAIRVFKGKEELHPGTLGVVLLFWVLASLTRPEYRYFGAVSVVVLFAKAIVKKQGKRILYHGFLVITAVVLIGGIRGFTQTEGTLGRTRQSIELSMAGRCIWPNVLRDYGLWPSSIKEYITLEHAIEADLYADNIERVIGRTLERKVGAESAKEYLRELACVGWSNYTKQVVTNTGWDVAGYTFSPIVAQIQFGGGAYESYTGRNYDIMSEHAPILTQYYFNYGSWWFALGLIFAFVLYVVNKCKISVNWSLVITCLGMVGYYTLRGAGMMDYKKSITITLLWMVWILLSYVDGKERAN